MSVAVYGGNNVERIDFVESRQLRDDVSTSVCKRRVGEPMGAVGLWRESTTRRVKRRRGKYGAMQWEWEWEWRIMLMHEVSFRLQSLSPKLPGPVQAGISHIAACTVAAL